MIHESSECASSNLSSYNDKSLLSKYSIPIEHLSYEYIEQCNIVKELERIVKILRSGEEGFYPDLLKKAEDKLYVINPNSRLLTVESPALTKGTMDQQDWNGAMHDLKMWTEHMKVRDDELSERNKCTTENIRYPPIRKDTVKQKPQCETRSASERISGSDYNKWDKYDAETEVLKLDLEEEKKKQERMKNEKTIQDDDSKLSELATQSENLLDVEKKYMAEQEKNRGNEYFNVKDYDLAVKYYTASIAILPTAVAYNNRAMCYLKMCKYTAALDDTNIAIAMDPNNVKAYFRRGLALQHKNRFDEALADLERVLQIEPNHTIAQHIANDLQAQCRSMPKKNRLLFEHRDESGAQRNKVVVVSDEEYKSNPDLQKGVKVNEWSLPSTVCNCNSVPPFVRNTTHPPPIAEHVLLLNRKRTEHKSAVKVVELDRHENNGSYYSGDEKGDRPKRLKIVEIDNIEETSVDNVNSSVPKFNLVDMRGKEHNAANNEPCVVNNEKGDSEMNVEVENRYKSGAIPKTKLVNRECCNSKTIKTSNNISSKEQDVLSEVHKNPLILNENKLKCHKHGNVGVGTKVSPYQFSIIWTSREPDALEKQAEVLRSVQPYELPRLIGKKLDETTLGSIIRCLKLKFDVSVEEELVKDYLVALTQCNRFSFITSFLLPNDCEVVRELVEELKPDEVVNKLMSSFSL